METSVTVQASCPFCGPVDVPARSFSCGVDPAASSRGLCQFTCPFCSRAAFLATAPAAAAALLAQGAQPFAGRPAPFELLEVRRGAPLSWDDLLDFHLALSAAPYPQEEAAPASGGTTSPTSTPPSRRRRSPGRRWWSTAN